VGAVIVKDGRVLARGYHHHFGAPHAEIDALSQLGQLTDAQGASMYVTLEPCSHYGKTPPCANRLVAVGIKRVFIGQVDPNPLVAGKGIAILRAAGIQVTVSDDTAQLNIAYNLFYQQHRPLVTLKVASSIDGKINLGAQQTKLTGAAADKDVQALRATQQAILIGEHTLTTDDPLLTVRTQTLAHPPIRVVLVRDADRLPTTLRLLHTPEPSYLLSERASKRTWPKQVKVLVRAKWDAAAVLKLLYSLGVQSLLVEGGSYIQSLFLATEQVDRWITYLSPIALGGTGLPVAVGMPLQQPLQFTLKRLLQLDEDVKVEYWRK
jgi:diaminohydroxyphosphoribosylaminopyrimidine deaminase/5-amino-6-(5-phosphoribosylamino)uracil reductase